jgi:valyl-tRNA synthetase
VEGIDSEGRLTQAAGEFAGLMISEGRDRIKEALAERGLISERTPSSQSVRVHERCDTPVEYIVTKQWFINALDHKEKLLEAGEGVRWYPDHMRARYRAWVEGLSWDWCISRQRYFGVPFPVWYCADCGEVLLATEDQLPVDPSDEQPAEPCSCGGTEFIPDQDVMDTWATSSMSPQIVTRWLADEQLYEQTFPMTLRPQAHEIIRTWAFYTILKSIYHFDVLPWRDVLISGWGLAGPGMPKVSKSRGGGPLPPMEMIERYSADAVRYWASSTGPGKDSIISEDKIQLGSKLVTKLWNVARFSARFLEGYQPDREIPELTSADRWILSQLQSLIARATELFERYDYAAAKSETETFFWRDLADNYIEMAKQRLYDAEHSRNEGARYTLYHVLLSVLKLFAPLLPHVTEEIYQGLFRETQGDGSIHIAAWPSVDGRLLDESAQQVGDMLVEIATAVRRYKSERSLKLSLELERLQLAVEDARTGGALQEAASDLMSVTRAQNIDVVEKIDEDLETIYEDEGLKAALKP